MKTCKVVLFVLAAAVLILGTISNATAQGNWIENTKKYYEFDIYNYCTGESFHVTAVGHTVSREFWEDNGGGWHISYHYNVQNAEAVGSSGNTYRASHSDNMQVYNRRCSVGEIGASLACDPPMGFPVAITFSRQIRLVGPGGPDDNLMIIWVAHLTINANGEVTAHSVNVTWPPLCQ